MIDGPGSYKIIAKYIIHFLIITERATKKAGKLQSLKDADSPQGIFTGREYVMLQNGVRGNQVGAAKLLAEMRERTGYFTALNRSSYRSLYERNLSARI